MCVCLTFFLGVKLCFYLGVVFLSCCVTGSGGWGGGRVFAGLFLGVGPFIMRLISSMLGGEGGGRGARVGVVPVVPVWSSLQGCLSALFLSSPAILFYAHGRFVEVTK